MRSKALLILVLIFFFANGLMAQEAQLPNFARSILVRDLQQHVSILASDSLQGRESGSPGAWMAADYIATCFERYGLEAPFNNSYFQCFNDSLRNVVGLIQGRDYPDEAIVLGAHYDHHGFYQYAVYNGADDNASGVAAMLEVARIMAAMVKSDYRPQRTIIFIAYDAKERSMAGSEWYVNHPLLPLKNTKACINLDMLGRVDAPPGTDTNYVMVLGADKHKTDLRAVLDFENRKRELNLDIDYTFYGSAAFADMFYKISDQYNFGRHNVPVLYFTSGMHDDLWKPFDDTERLSYTVLQNRARLVFYTLWNIAN